MSGLPVVVHINADRTVTGTYWQQSVVAAVHLIQGDNGVLYYVPRAYFTFLAAVGDDRPASWSLDAETVFLHLMANCKH